MAYSANKRQKVKKEEGRKEAGASKKVGKKSIFASLPGGLHQTNNFTQKERPFQAKAIVLVVAVFLMVVVIHSTLKIGKILCCF